MKKAVVYSMCLMAYCVTLCSCRPQPLPVIDSRKDDLPYDIIWQTPLHPDTLFSVTHYVAPKIYRDRVIFSRRVRRSENQKLVAFNRFTGELLWVWNDYFVFDGSKGYTKVRTIHSAPVYRDNLMFFTSYTGVFAVDMYTGKTVFKYKEPERYYGQGDINVYGSKIFHPVSDDSMNIMRMIDYRTGEIREVFRMKRYEDGYNKNMYSPGCWVNGSGDTIIVFQSRESRRGPYGSRSILFSYNITRDSLMWADTIVGVSSIDQPPYIEGERIYFLIDDVLLCLDVHTAERLWVMDGSWSIGTFNGHQMLVTEEYFFLCNTVGFLVVIEKESGHYWYLGEVGGNPDYHMAYHNGRVYLTDHHSLTIVDIFNSKNGSFVLYKLKTHNYNIRTPGSFRNGVAIDGERGYMYISDGFYAMCLTLPE